MTFLGRVAELNDHADVLEAVVRDVPAPISGTGLFRGRIRYVRVFEDSAEDNTVELVGVAHGEAEEAWYWVGQPPAVLRAAAPEETYFGAKAITRAQAKQYVDGRWGVLNPSATETKQFQVEGLGDNLVRVTAYFDVAGQREHRSYLVWLVDPAGPFSGANIKFERVVTG